MAVLGLSLHPQVLFVKFPNVVGTRGECRCHFEMGYISGRDQETCTHLLLPPLAVQCTGRQFN